MRQLAHHVEMFGGAKLEGLSKKDQQVRSRAAMGLKPQKAQKRPYTHLVALRKKQKVQDDVAADLARKAGMRVRKVPPAAREPAKASRSEPGDPHTLRGGVLHVSKQQASRTKPNVLASPPHSSRSHLIPHASPSRFLTFAMFSYMHQRHFLFPPAFSCQIREVQWRSRMSTKGAGKGAGKGRGRGGGGKGRGGGKGGGGKGGGGKGGGGKGRGR